MTTVGDSERLARYVLTKGHLYKDGRMGNLMRPDAWIPNPSVELSVYRVDQWTEEEIAAKGHEVAAVREKKHRADQLAKGVSYPEGKVTFRYLGRGEILASQVREQKLDVLPHEPPVRHANIVNWPPLQGNRKQDHSAQMVFGLRLQENCCFFGPTKTEV